MKSHAQPLFLATALIALAFSPLSSLQGAEDAQSEHKELPAKSGGTVKLTSCIGSIEVKTHSQEVVTYDAALQPDGRARRPVEDLLDRVEFNYETADGDVTITMRWKDGLAPRNGNFSVRQTLVIPAHYSVDVHTSAGSIRGENIDGQVRAKTSAGEIQFAKVNGALDAHTSGGNISVSQVKGDTKIGTSGGNIKIDSVQGDLNGSTSGGSITASLESQIEKPLALTTSGGNIRLAVPANLDANLRATTSGGRVGCTLPLQGSVKRESVNGKINSGGPEIKLRTSGGNIDVAAR